MLSDGEADAILREAKRFATWCTEHGADSVQVVCTAYGGGLTQIMRHGSGNAYARIEAMRETVEALRDA